MNNKKTITPLSPKRIEDEELERIKPYLEQLKLAIETEGVYNIALSGGYGSGKSSILKTFQHINSNKNSLLEDIKNIIRKNKKYNFLNVSLASFNKVKEENHGINSTSDIKGENEQERILEISILQQIFYHTKPSDIPESRFKRIANISFWTYVGVAILSVLWCLSTFILFRYDYIDRINPTNWSKDYPIDRLSVILFLITSIGVGIFSSKTFKFLKTSKVSKISISGELELGEGNDKSIFNEYIDEIIYFFERTKYDIIFIEDLDRFKNTNIFTKLREINILLNNAKTINRKIVFIYAIGDYFFDKQERVKFFDYIIPVIPFIDASNAKEQLKCLIKKHNLSPNVLSDEFISDVTIFISDIDMRLLTNIFNEFIIYRNILKGVISKDEELFAIITYKNIENGDFIELIQQRGKLYDLFYNKSKHTENIIKESIVEIDEKKKEIEEIEENNIININELKKIYLFEILSKVSTTTKAIDMESLLSTFDEIISNQKIEGINYNYNYNYYNGRRESFSFDFREIEKEIDAKHTYKERLKLIEAKNSDKIKRIEKEIYDLETKRRKIEKQNLAEILKPNQTDIRFEDFNNPQLMKNLLINGYINENYQDYISLFHEGTLNKKEIFYIRNVKSSSKPDFDFKPDNIENLVKEISPKYFETVSILNFHIVDFLGKNYTLYKEKYDAMIDLLSKGDDISIDFIQQYVLFEDKENKNLIQKIANKWQDFFEKVTTNYESERKERLLLLLIKYADTEDIISQNDNQIISDMIESNSGFLSLLEDISSDRIISVFKELEIKFIKLENPTDSTKIYFEDIYRSNRYKINIDNVLQMYLYERNDNGIDLFNTSNYSAIMDSNRYLKEYINKNIEEYIEKVYLNLEEEQNEKEEYYMQLLNNECIEEEQKVKIIKKVITEISQIEKIESTLIQEELFKNARVAPNWRNVIVFYNNSEDNINESLIEYLEKDEIKPELSKEKIEENESDFEYSLLVCNELSNDTYRELLKSCSSDYFNGDIDFSSLEGKKVIILIENDFQRFIKNIDKFTLERDEDVILLNSQVLTIENKFNYINHITNKYLQDIEILAMIGSIIIEKSEQNEFDYATIAPLIDNQKQIEHKIELIRIYNNKLTDSELIDRVSLLGDNYSNIFDGKRPKFEKTEYNRLLFNLLEKRNLIHRPKEEKDNFFRVQMKNRK